MSRASRPETAGILLPSDPLVEGMGTPPGELLFLGLKLRERQERALQDGGARLWEANRDAPSPDNGDPGPAPLAETQDRERLVVADDVALSGAAVAEALAMGRQAGEPVRFVPGGELGTLLEEASLGRGDRRPFLVAWLPPGAPCTLAALRQARELTMDPREQTLELPVSRLHFGAEVLQVPLAERLIFPTGHWLQALWANLLALGPFLWRELAGRSVPVMAWRLTGAALRARSVQPYRVGARLGRKGRDCRVHPRATSEGNWLGEGVEIGANAVVRGCVLADGARVEEGALAEFSVLGPGASILRHGWAKFSLLEAGASCGGAMQLGVLASEAATKYGSVLMDLSLGQGVRVSAAGRLHRAPLGIAGVCVGARTTLGSGVFVAPGRALPPDLTVSSDPAHTLARLPDALEPGRYAVRDGTLQAL